MLFLSCSVVEADVWLTGHSSSHMGFWALVAATLEADSPDQCNKLCDGSFCWYFVFYPICVPFSPSVQAGRLSAGLELSKTFLVTHAVHRDPSHQTKRPFWIILSLFQLLLRWLTGSMSHTSNFFTDGSTATSLVFQQNLLCHLLQ